MPTAAETIVEALRLHGVPRAFVVPGESYLPVLTAAIAAGFELVTCRHEAAAANMAEATAKLTGRAGVAMVTRGPGATHAAIGVHTARQDSTPMLLLVGQVGTGMTGREAFQEIDYRLMFGAVAKAVIVIDRADRAHEQMAAALALAEGGRPGPVVVVLPEDVLEGEASPAVAAPLRVSSPAPDPAAVAEAARLLVGAARPLMIVGGPGWDEPTFAAVQSLAERARLPVATSWRRKDRFDNAHPLYAGELGLGSNPALLDRVRAADLLLVLGARLGENPTQGYTLPAVPVPAQTLVHVHPDPGAIGTVYRPTLGVVSAVGAFALALALAVEGPAGEAGWAEGCGALHPAWMQPTTVEAGVNLAEVIARLSVELPDDAVLCNGAGNFAAWLHRFHRHRRLGTQLAPTSGAMGYGVPAGIAAKLLHPEREAVVVAGDGDFLMSGQELATAAQYGLGVLFLVVDNGQYGTIRMHQARDFPGTPAATRLANPDFAAYAASFGAWGARVETTEAFAPVLTQARAATAAGRPALIHLLTDPDEISPGRRLGPGA